MNFQGKNILITGGTGSLGKELTRALLGDLNVRRLVILSRDEWKQQQMAQEFQDKRLRFFIGDVRDRKRLKLAFKGVDYIIHAAALKQVPSCEYNPFEAVQTNIIGAQNIIEAAIDCNVQKIIALSTDKATNPVNLYGATKLCSDKIFTAANIYAANVNTRFSVVRYGNVLGSRGSVIPFFLKEREKGVLPITDLEMTRFWITIEEAGKFVLDSLDRMLGGELFVPKIPSMKIVDMAKALCPECELRETGIRPGEKIHEVMIPQDEARQTLEFEGYYIIQPAIHPWSVDTGLTLYGGQRVSEQFHYSSDTNDRWLTSEEFLGLIEGSAYI